MKKLAAILGKVLLFLLSFFISPPTFALPARKVIINADVYTMNVMHPKAEAIVIDDNKFVYVGTSNKAKEFINKNTQVFDLNGHMVLPGFIESHVHPTFGSLFANTVLLDKNADKEKLLADIKKTVVEKQKEKVICMTGFKASVFGPDGPTASDLDIIEKQKPVIILDYGGHSAWVNSKALEIANITANTPDPVPGSQYYKRNKQGKPTGWCIESMSFIPILFKTGFFNPEMIKAAEENLFPIFSEFGITTVYDAGSLLESKMFETYLELEKENKLPFRVFGSHYVTAPMDLPSAIKELKKLDKKFKSNLVTINTMKIVYDGTLEAFSCAMFKDFLNDKGNKGFELVPPKVLSNFVKKIDVAGYNIHIHAIGNRAISDTLTAFENLKKQKGTTNTRKTICHLQFFMPDTVDRFKALKDVVAQTTPTWMVRDTDTEKAVGKDIYERQMLFNSLDKAGVKVTFGSDFPVSDGLDSLNPFNEIEIGHMRRSIGDKDSDFLAPASERLPIDTLLRGYTINGAYQLGVEDKLGSIEKGKLADMIVLDKNLYTQDPATIHNNKVLLTIMDGKIKFNILKKQHSYRAAICNQNR